MRTYTQAGCSIILARLAYVEESTHNIISCSGFRVATEFLDCLVKCWDSSPTTYF
jgi:hypothetical protein